MAAHLSMQQDLPGDPSSSFFWTHFRRRSQSSTLTTAEHFPKQQSRRRSSLFTKLASSRGNAKSLLRLGDPAASFAALGSPAKTTTAAAAAAARSTHRRPVSEIILSPRDAHMISAALDVEGGGGSLSDTASLASGGLPAAASSHDRSSHGSLAEQACAFPTLRNEKVVATGSGIVVSVALTEPVLFLAGYDQNDPSTKKSTILRGQLHLKVTKSVKVKKISITFRGHAQTDWPDGIPPKKVQFHDKKDLVTQGVIYFNHGDTALMQNDYGAHFYRHAKPMTPTAVGKDGTTATITHELHARSGRSSPTTNNNNNHNNNGSQMSSRDLKRLSLQSNHSRSFGKNDNTSSGAAPPQRNYRLFPVGDYLYSFEFPVDGSLPETIKTDLGSVRYDLEAIVERAGAFRPNLLGTLEVPVIRTPAEGSLEQVEPIAISRNWEDQLHYDIVISGKSFPLGTQIPIAFKLTPLAKVECHRIKVFVTENIQHWTSDKSVHRFQPAKKVLLFEKRADSASVSTYPGSSMRVTAGGGIDWDQRAAAARGEEVVDRSRTNLLGNLSSDYGVGPTEMEFSVQLPSCYEMKHRDDSQRLHFDTTYENIQINHWIKIVLRLSKVDERDPTKRRHFEISIDSPFHILSCKATQANIFLPAYTSPDSEPVVPAQEFECGCPGAPSLKKTASQVQIHSGVESNGTGSSSGATPGPSTGGGPGAVTRSFTNSSGGLARPPQAHLAHEPNERSARPMHLLRAPSFAPPSFDEVEAPPPLITPPPEYNSVIGDHDRESVLEDYFNRLSFYEEHEEDEHDTRGLGRVDVPLTPGRRVNRSMDVPRDWVRLDGLIISVVILISSLSRLPLLSLFSLLFLLFLFFPTSAEMITISPLTEEDIPETIEVIQTAFADDPYFKWVFDKSRFNKERNYGSLHARCLWGIHNALFFVAKTDSDSDFASAVDSASSDKDSKTSRVVGVSCWLPPSPEKETWYTWSQGLLLSARQMVNNLLHGGRGGLRVNRYWIWKARQTEAQREIWQGEEGGFYFCNIVAIRPGFQGQGIGKRLMQCVLEKADAEGKKCYLESSRDEPNVQIYGTMGFKVVKTMECQDGGDTCMALVYISLDPLCSYSSLLHYYFTLHCYLRMPPKYIFSATITAQPVQMTSSAILYDSVVSLPDTQSKLSPGGIAGVVVGIAIIVIIVVAVYLKRYRHKHKDSIQYDKNNNKPALAPEKPTPGKATEATEATRPRRVHLAPIITTRTYNHNPNQRSKYLSTATVSTPRVFRQHPGEEVQIDEGERICSSTLTDLTVFTFR
ncbi:hypothetical protein ASPZODRAFT_139183 [Penicilliopsis zonata CBS 506.65]|uniref:N-acetyltransferase domain-containing protein n=1 Tax=Penicilliopsis zonata CBS 506.65 TaxID=1073090 RepID=A0A1L9SRS4_9EURO|nr:hypothetical protein ASPZODRAFT_139183 [Penicilliopsis zonata CBS 506.65]OJJ49826.1 hypothetical protein ASPZODRAFT_139183 [Penicilliopsis zonata CBS 506.65]